VKEYVDCISMGHDDVWCREDALPEETRCRVEGMKTMARWLLGLKGDVLSAQKTFRMLNAFITQKGDLLSSGRLSQAEMSWLRLAAGCAMLKICEQKGVGDQYSVEQFYNLSQLMVDEVPQVREIFATKLHKGLGKGIPNKCLPLDFMGFYALAGFESDKRLKVLMKTYMLADINKRRDYIKQLTMGSTGGESRDSSPVQSFAAGPGCVVSCLMCGFVAGSVDKAMGQIKHILPDYMLVFAVPVLAHHPEFTSNSEIDQLTRIKQCLWFVLEPLITKNDFYSYTFYKDLVDRMKNHKDALKPDDEAFNMVSPRFDVVNIHSNCAIRSRSCATSADWVVFLRLDLM